MREGTSNLVSGSIIILLGIAMLLETTKAQYTGMGEGFGTGPAFFPRILMGAFIVTGFIILLSGIRQKGKILESINKRKLSIFILITSVLFFSVPRLGFLFSAFPFLMVAMWVMGFRKKRWIVAISLVFSLCSWYLFNFVFEIILPTSPWFINV